MKRIIKVVIALIMAMVMTFALTGCGNMDMIDTVFTYDYAIIIFPDGTHERVEIKQWGTYDGEQIQIISEDGKIYLTSSYNCILVQE